MTTVALRILIVRLSAVGDCVQTLPLAWAVRERFPQAHLAWVVEPGAAPLVQAVRAIDRVIVVPRGFARSPAALLRLRRELRSERFDLTLDPQGLTKSGLVARLSGARRRIGLARPAARELNPWLQTELVVSRARHRVDRYLELLGPLGVERPAVRFGLEIPAAAEDKADELAALPQFQAGYAVLNPGAGWDSKLWPVERYAEVARRLARSGLPSVVTWGGQRERAWAEQIVAQADGAATLAPPTTLLELAAVLRAARLFVGSDTGPLHLAAAVGTPCVALFGASDGAACGPYGSGHLVIQAAFDRSADRKRPGADNWAMRQIAAEMVTEACEKFRSAVRGDVMLSS
jgi:heptosyltransferase-1